MKINYFQNVGATSLAFIMNKDQRKMFNMIF
jgi:hypothetical protein